MPDHKNDDLESARILIQENLLDEAKKVLYRIVSRGSEPRAHTLLEQIEKIELKEILSKPSAHKKLNPEDTDQLIAKLENDLRITEDKIDQEQWNVGIVDQMLDAQALYDLGVAFFEMGCYTDAIRELKKAEKKIRIDTSFLGNLGISVVALIAESMVRLERAFDAKVFLDPILLEPDLPHEQKLILYYTMGLAEQSLDDLKSALGWYKKVIETDPAFRDVEQRVRIITRQ